MAEEVPDNIDSGSAASGPDSPEQMAEEALASAAQAVQTISAQTGDSKASQPVTLPEFGANANGESDPAALGLLDDVTLRVKIELGRTQMYVEDVLRLNPNSVVELDKAAGDPVDIYVNDRHVARGEVLVLNENFCVRVSEILQPIGPED